MILGFKKTMLINGKRKPTNFEDKILKGIKLHTIRFDEKDRWKPGVKIHAATGVRSSNYNCFKEDICHGVQSIAIHALDNLSVNVDGVDLNRDEIENLAINDGFDSVDDFWRWFSFYGIFEGKLIHWTNMRYGQINN